MKLLVVCTGNSCRSQIAEGLLRNKFSDYEVFSAGTHPETSVNPYAVRAMQERDIDISTHYPKLVDDFKIQNLTTYLLFAILQMKYVQFLLMLKT